MLSSSSWRFDCNRLWRHLTSAAFVIGVFGGGVVLMTIQRRVLCRYVAFKRSAAWRGMFVVGVAA